MKRLAAVLTLILCLSLPVFAGHTQAGFGWCNCDNPASHQQGLRIEDEEDSQRIERSELEMYLTSLSILLRIKI